MSDLTDDEIHAIERGDEVCRAGETRTYACKQHGTLQVVTDRVIYDPQPSTETTNPEHCCDQLRRVTTAEGDAIAAKWAAK